jgi:NF-kappa-B inhibitor-like protein 1
VRKERQEKEARARAESERILSDERARDSAWRRAALLPPPAEPRAELRSVRKLREAYEAGWAALGAALEGAGARPLPAAGIGYADVPWLVPDPADVETAEAVLLHGVEGPADVRRRLRAELLRWHPDKFVARLGARLAAGERERVLAGVQATSQLLTGMVSR